MSSPSPFQIGREAGNNFGNAFARVKDENAIERILSEAMGSGDPEALQGSITKILSQVSPERQGPAMQVLQNAYSNVQKRQDQSRLENQKKQEQLRLENQGREAAQQGGYTYGAPPQVQAQQLKDRSKNQRLSQYGLSSDQNVPSNLSNAQNGTNPYSGGIRSVQDGKEENSQLLPNSGQSIFKKLTDDQLVVASGAPDREVSEPAKAELKRRADERGLDQKKTDATRKYHTEISQDILKENEKDAKNLVQSESALGLMENAITGKDLSFWSPDNLAEITGIEAFRSPEGALFKTAGKEFFLGTLTSAGARPNQFIEQQIVEMLPKIGRSTAANLSVSRAFRNEIDLKKEKVRLTRDLADELESKLGYVPRNIGQIRDQKLKEYADKKQKELNNDLRAFKSIEEKSKQSFMKVDPGTPISKVVAKAILDQYDKKDPDRAKKAAKQAEELGYTF